jgi:hypothetical protein
MTTTNPHGWHADDDALRAYAEGRGLPLASASVEGHLMACAECRTRFAPMMAAEPLTKAWEAIRSTVEAPRRSAVERLLGRMGVSEETSRLLAAVPAFGEAWLVGMVAVTVFSGVAASFSERFGLAVFLLVAPLAPVAGVSASYGGDADPSYELGTVAPYSALRLLLLRTAGVLALSVPTAVVVGFVLPGPDWLAVAWLTPAVAGVTLCLALSPRLGTTAAAATVGGAWAVTVLVAVRAHSPLAVVDPTMQLVLAGLTVAALGALVQQHSVFDRLGRQS